jgi:hypothetical protein
MTVTLSDHVYQKLIRLSDDQGRSLSNLAAFLLERSLEPLPVGNPAMRGGQGLRANKQQDLKAGAESRHALLLFRR